MKFKTTALALALVAVTAPAFAADDTTLNNGVTLVTDVESFGGVGISGDVEIASQSSASVDQNQSTNDQWSIGDGDHSADLNGDALSGASGNIGVNVAAGVGNVQANDTALAALDGDMVFASATVTTSQETSANLGATLVSGTYYSANASGDALAGARGNIGLNLAGGVGNGQSNAMAASVNSSGTLAVSASDSEQISSSNTLQALGDLDTFAVLGGGTLAGAQGNIAASVASGVGNLQHNGLTIAAGGQ